MMHVFRRSLWSGIQAIRVIGLSEIKLKAVGITSKPVPPFSGAGFEFASHVKQGFSILRVAVVHKVLVADALLSS
jgi:hypothetical protein